MKKRIGKDLTIVWTVPSSFLGNATLSSMNLSLELSHVNGTLRYSMPFTVTASNKLSTVWYGKDQTTTGLYNLTLWRNKGADGAYATDVTLGYLVSRTWNEDDTCSPELTVTSTTLTRT